MTTQGSETAGNVCVLYNISTKQNKCVVSSTFGGGMLGCALELCLGLCPMSYFHFSTSE